MLTYATMHKPVQLSLSYMWTPPSRSTSASACSASRPLSDTSHVGGDAGADVQRKLLGDERRPRYMSGGEPAGVGDRGG